MSRFSAELIDAIEAAMTETGDAPRVIAARMPGTALGTVRLGISDLVAQRRAAYEGDIGRRLYRRISPAERTA